MAIDLLLLETGDFLLLEGGDNLILEPTTADEADTIATRLSGTVVLTMTNSATSVLKNGS
jgi:hypothetical protein